MYVFASPLMHGVPLLEVQGQNCNHDNKPIKSTIIDLFFFTAKGSKDTLPANAFALSLFSLLLQFAHKQLKTLAVSLHSSQQQREDDAIAAARGDFGEEMDMLAIFTSSTTSEENATAGLSPGGEKEEEVEMK